MTRNKMFEQPHFSWHNIHGTLDPNIITARSPDNPNNRTRTFAIIATFSHQLPQQLRQTTPTTAEFASNTCAHASWIFVLERNKAEAQKQISFALKFAATGFAKYVESAVKRAKGDFQGALDSAVAAIELFKNAEENNTVLAHAYIQAGLAAFRLNRSNEAKLSFETAENLARASILSTAKTRTYAEQTITSSEGDALGRMFINLAQVYNRLHQYEDALRCLNQIQHDSPIQTAYSNNVFAETYIGLEQYDKAKELLDEAYDFYHQEKLLETDNAFRNMLGSLEVNLARNKPLEQLTAIRTLYKTLQYEPTHDFKLRLDAIFTALKLQAEMLITSEQYNEAKPLLHEVYCYYLDTLEVSLELKKPTEHVEEAKALHLVLQYEKKDELTQRLHNIIAAIEEPIGLAAQFHSNFTT